jgi:hypothetical protein
MRVQDRILLTAAVRSLGRPRVPSWLRGNSFRPFAFIFVGVRGTLAPALEQDKAERRP